MKEKGSLLTGRDQSELWGLICRDPHFCMFALQELENILAPSVFWPRIFFRNHSRKGILLHNRSYRTQVNGESAKLAIGTARIAGVHACFVLCKEKKKGVITSLRQMLDGILKCVRNQPCYNFKSSVKTKTPIASLLCRRGCTQNLLSVLSELFHEFAFSYFCHKFMSWLVRTFPCHLLVYYASGVFGPESCG